MPENMIADNLKHPLHRICAGGVFYVPTESAIGMRSTGFWLWTADGNLVRKRPVLSLVRFPCDFLGVICMPEKIIGINLSLGEYALVSEEP